ncbi:hypothetical protein [Rhizobium sp. RM]|uniref:hypothetical protein n=1 Tax=Rhizobium sp. RM TaxID=2748079 RepID=UPI00110D6970|nr:hypothetical protein [Rhizobium sp. RM]NWJ27582.1 hypothetical protein [Rhizobium sp. RM]TMV19964.1 hypothetical protein BJG94_11230 [Rhizobium sp. Td3]
MPIGSGIPALVGVAGLVSWIAAGLVNVIGYNYSFERPAGISALLSSALFSLGVVLEAVMTSGIFAGA